MSGEKLKLAIYWASACGGCDVSILDLHEKILDVAAAADILLWPIALDFKYHHVSTMPDRHIDVCLFNGAVRNSENEKIARLLRAKSKVMVAFGSCSAFGGIPGLANASDKNELFRTVYGETATTNNPDFVTPAPTTETSSGDLEIPEFYDTVKSLPQTVDVDYVMPGCPPSPDRVWEVVQAIIGGNLPPKGSVVGASAKTLCDECPRSREEKRIKKFYRPHEIKCDPEKCLIDQGVICLGPATRAGCGTQCLKANMPCRGCYGPAAGIEDHGAKMLSALASVVDSNDPKEIETLIEQIVDPLGTFYRFTLPSSLMRRCVMGSDGKGGGRHDGKKKKTDH